MEINLQKMEDSNKQSENNTKNDPKRQLNYLIEKHKKELEEIQRIVFLFHLKVNSVKRSVMK